MSLPEAPVRPGRARNLRGTASDTVRQLVSRLVLVALLLTSGALAAVKIPARATQRVLDQGSVLSTAQERRIEQALQGFEAATGGQMVILTVSSLDGEAIKDLGIRVADAWKIGGKDADDGAILIVAVEDRKLCLEIGYGWEGNVNDARAGDIIRAMGPDLRKGDYEAGIIRAITSMQTFITGVAAPRVQTTQRRPRGKGIFPIIIALWVLTILFSGYRRSRGFTTYSSRGRRHHGGYWGGGFGGGFGGGSGGGGFSGGGGGFGGGGASGGW